MWRPLLDRLKGLGYEEGVDMRIATHDWRLGIPQLEARDQFFTKLKLSVEELHQRSSLKVYLLSHSYGAIVTRSFMHWAEEQEAGWVEQHLEGEVKIAGADLGVPNALAALFTGMWQSSSPQTCRLL